MADFTFAHRQEGFDEHIDWSIRGYRNLLNDTISFSRYFVENNTNVVDIGCSTGKLTTRIMEYNNEISSKCSSERKPLSSKWGKGTLTITAFSILSLRYLNWLILLYLYLCLTVHEVIINFFINLF